MFCEEICSWEKFQELMSELGGSFFQGRNWDDGHQRHADSIRKKFAFCGVNRSRTSWIINLYRQTGVCSWCFSLGREKMSLQGISDSSGVGFLHTTGTNKKPLNCLYNTLSVRASDYLVSPLKFPHKLEFFPQIPLVTPFSSLVRSVRFPSIHSIIYTFKPPCV